MLQIPKICSKYCRFCLESHRFWLKSGSVIIDFTPNLKDFDIYIEILNIFVQIAYIPFEISKLLVKIWNIVVQILKILVQILKIFNRNIRDFDKRCSILKLWAGWGMGGGRYVTNNHKKRWTLSNDPPTPLKRTWKPARPPLQTALPKTDIRTSETYPTNWVRLFLTRYQRWFLEIDGKCGRVRERASVS